MRYQTAEAAEIPVSKAVQAVEARKVFEKRIRLVGQIMVGVFIIGFWEFSSRVSRSIPSHSAHRWPFWPSFEPVDSPAES